MMHTSTEERLEYLGLRMIRVELNLTNKQAALLDDLLLSYSDKGPFGFGWKTDEAYELAEMIRRKIEVQVSINGYKG